MLKYSRSTHRFFDQLVSYLTSLVALGVALEAHARNQALRIWGPTDYLTLEGSSATNIEMRFAPRRMLDIIASNGWPTELELDDRPRQAGPPHPIMLTGLHGVHGTLIQSAFVHYFESQRDKVETKHGTNFKQWPPIWNFARVVRNAFAHGGLISFENPNSQPVSWRGLTYGPQHNGRQILYTDVTPVEIILLMDEMDKFL